MMRVMVLETEQHHAENTHYLVKIQIPGSVQRSQDKLQLTGSSNSFTHCLDVSGIEIQIPSTTGNDSKPGGKIQRQQPLRGRVTQDPDHNPRSSGLVNHKGMERPIAMKREPSPEKWRHHGVLKKLVRRQKFS